MAFISLAVLIIAAVILLSLLFKLLKTPLKFAFKFLIHAGLGFAALWLINFFGSPLGIYLGMNWLNAAIIGILGVPGAILLVVLSFVL